MKILYYLISILLFASINICSCQNRVDDLEIKFLQEKGFYLSSKKGNWKSDFYDFIETSDNGYFVVSKKNKYGIANNFGEVVIPIASDDAELIQEFLITYEFKDKSKILPLLSVYNLEGKKLFSRNAFNCNPLNAHLFMAKVSVFDTELINSKGKTLKKLAKHKVKEIYPNIFLANEKDGNKSCLDELGNKINCPNLIPFEEVNPETSKYRLAHIGNDNFVIVDNDGSTIAIPDGYKIKYLKFGYAVLQNDASFFQIFDIKNNKLLPNSKSTSLSEIKITKCYNGRIFFKDIQKGEEIVIVNEADEIIGRSLALYSKTLLDENGNCFVSDLCSLEPNQFYLDDCNFKIRKTLFTMYQGKDGAYIFENTEGQLHTFKNLEMEYGQIGSLVKRNQKNGILGQDFEFLVEPIYDKVEYFKAGGYKVYHNDKVGAYDRDGNQIFPVKYKNIWQIYGRKKKRFYVAMENDKYQLFSSAGTLLDEHYYDQMTIDLKPGLTKLKPVKLTLKSNNGMLIINHNDQIIVK